MRQGRDNGVVLINALVIVLTISTIAAALLTRSEAARIRTSDSQSAQQIALYLDGAELLIPVLLDPVIADVIAHPGQGWASGGLIYEIDRGRVRADLTDLQGRLNINWLMRDGDDYVEDLFGQVFSELGLSSTLLAAVTEFVRNGGPRNVSSYLARRPAILPQGGPLTSIEDLREADGVSPEEFDILRQYFSALPNSTRLNINTVPEFVLEAAIAPLPSEVAGEILSSDAPIVNFVDIRAQITELRESEDLSDLPLEMLTFTSAWFQADLTATLDGMTQSRNARLYIAPTDNPKARVVQRWAHYD